MRTFPSLLAVLVAVAACRSPREAPASGEAPAAGGAPVETTAQARTAQDPGRHPNRHVDPAVRDCPPVITPPGPFIDVRYSAPGPDELALEIRPMGLRENGSPVVVALVVAGQPDIVVGVGESATATLRGFTGSSGVLSLEIDHEGNERTTLLPSSASPRTRPLVESLYDPTADIHRLSIEYQGRRVAIAVRPG